MPKSPDKHSSPAIERTPSQESWLSRNRGAITFALIFMGCAAEPTPPSVPTVEKKNDVPVSATTASEDVTNKIDVNEVYAMPSVCEISEGTFLAKSPGFNQFCEGGPIKEGKGCVNADDWEKKEKIDHMKFTALLQLIRVNNAEKKQYDSFPEPVVKLDECQKFESLPDPYKTALKEFDPALYESLSKRVYIKKDNAINSVASVGMPYNLTQNELVPSPFGQYHIIETDKPMTDINLSEALKNNDRERIIEYLRNAEILTHEIYGHIVMNDRRLADVTGRGDTRFDEMCLRGIPGAAENEMYAYFKGIGMVSFIAGRHPEIQKILREAYTKREDFFSRKKQTAICSEREGKNYLNKSEKETTLFQMAEELEYYQKAEETGNWQLFRDMIFGKILAVQFGLPHLLTYLKTHEKEDCASALNGRLERIANRKESPEEIVIR